MSDALYRHPELIQDRRERPNETVFICEGEKDVDTLRNMGQIATTNANGALSWNDDFNSEFADAVVAILVDNDDNGRDRGSMLKRRLQGVARRLATIELPGLREHGDVSDWVADGHSRDDLLQFVQAKLAEIPDLSDVPPLPFIDPAQWEGVPVPPREYMVEGLVLASTLTAHTGKGATGKSLLMQQMATAIAAGSLFLGHATTRGNAAYLTAEDSERELHERQVDICRALKVRLSSLSGRLFVGSMIAFENKALASATRDDRMKATGVLTSLRMAIEEHKLKFVALDNVGHFFDGNEIIRSQVVAFTGMLNKLALETQCAIVMIAHPNKAGDTYSGSTAWQNQVRAELHLAKPGQGIDPNVRELSMAKANYAPGDGKIRVVWHRGAFLLDDEVPDDDPERLTVMQHSANAIFLACLRAVTEQGRAASHSPNAGKAFAANLFEGLREAQGMRAADLNAAMERLLRSGAIDVGALPFDGSSKGHKARGLRIVQRDGADDAAM